MKKLFSIFILAGISLGAYCQEKIKAISKFFDKIEVKKSFDSKLDKTKPAIASFTIPAGSKDYFTINGGIAYRVSKLKASSEDNQVASKTQLDIYSVYNRNNQIKKEQNNFKAGFSLEKKYLFLKRDGITPKDFMLFVNSSNEYIRDWIDTTNSFASLLYCEPWFTVGDKFKIGKPVTSGSGEIISYVKLMPGLEYQNKFEVPASDSKGVLARLFLSATYEWYFRWREKKGDKSSKLVNMFEISGNYTYRNDFYNSTKNREGYLPLVNFTAAFYPFRNENISLGANYQKGSDPVNGIDDQEFWQFVFKFRKDLKK